MRPNFAVVESAPESLSARVRRLQAEARAAADEAATEALVTAADLCRQLADLADMRDILPEGERDAYVKLAAEIESRRQSIQAVRARRK